MSLLNTFILASAFTPGINVLHYRINISRVANYERFLFKRLSGSGNELFNWSAQPYQRKSERPCQGEKKKKTNKKNQQGPADNKAPEESSALENRSFCPLFVQADVDWDNQSAEKDAVSLMNLS